MADAPGAAPTKRCPRCARHRTREFFTPSGWPASGAYCRPCRTEATRQWRSGGRVMTPLSADELNRLRSLVACLVCDAVPRVVGVNKKGHDVVRAKHAPDCTAVDPNLRKTG